jgi:hypothetical protein
MFLSLIPWLVFSVVVNRHGVNAAGDAAVAATALAVVFLVRNAGTGSVKMIDLAGVVTFGLLTVTCFVAGSGMAKWVADYGRGASAAVLAVVMIGSAVTVPFTEQYARESVPREFWSSPRFRSVNRRISAVWGSAIAVMACGHLLAGYLDPVSTASSGARPTEVLLNWALPIVLILGAVGYTKSVSGAADHDSLDRAARTSASVSQ